MANKTRIAGLISGRRQGIDTLPGRIGWCDCIAIAFVIEPLLRKSIDRRAA
jgi:hypothetical protein